MGQDRRICDCGKVCYGGPGEARRAHAAAHYRIRIYVCDLSGRYHVTNGDKRTSRQFSREGIPEERRKWNRKK